MSRTGELVLASVMFVIAAAAALFWLPNDIETGLFYTHRRQTYIGDALIPAICVGGILIVSVAHFVINWLARKEPSKPSDAYDRSYWVFCLSTAAVLVLGCVVMYWAGPLAVSLFGPDGDPEITYRQLRDTLPWSLMGYALGGLFILLGLAAIIEGRVRAVRVLSSVLAVLALIFVFQGTIEGLLLPPNGDW